MNQFQEYCVDVSDIPPNSNLTLMFIVSSSPTPTGDVLFGLNVDPTKQTMLYSSRSKVSFILGSVSSLPPPLELELENDLTEQIAQIHREQSAMKSRQVSFILLVVYSGIAAILLLSYVTHCAILNWFPRRSPAEARS